MLSLVGNRIKSQEFKIKLHTHNMTTNQPVDPTATKQKIQAGELPSNTEIEEALEAARRAQVEIASSEPKLSETGKAVMGDVQRIIETTETIIREKNEGEVLQETLKHAARSGQVGTTTAAGLVSALSPEQLKSELKEDTTSITTIVKLMISSAEFREIIVDLLSIGQSYLLPSEEQKAPEKTEKSFKEALQEGEQAELKTEEPKPETRVMTDRFFTLVNDMQSHPDYQQAIHYLIDRLAYLYDQVKAGTWKSYWSPEKVEDMEASKREAWEAAKNAQKLMENWSRSSLDPIIDHLVKFIDKAKDDQQLIDSIEQLGHFVNNCVSQEGYLNDKDWVMNEVNERFDTIKAAAWDKYRGDVDEIQSELNMFIDNLRRDPTSVNLQHDLSSLYQHLFLDSEGRPAFKPELISDLRVVLPAILRQLMHVKSPDIQYSDEQMDFNATNVVINVSELAPAQLRLSYVADFEAMQRSTVPEAANIVKIEIYGIHAAANNIDYMLNKHHGFPLWKDVGKADLRIYGRGMDIGVLMEPVLEKTTTSKSTTEATGGLAVIDSKCVIHGLDLKLYDTKHDWMYTVIGPIVRSMLKSRLENSIAESIKSWDLTASIPVSEKIAATIPVPVLEPLAEGEAPKQTEPVI